MTVDSLVPELDLKPLTCGSDKEIASCYISDLLSRVMGGCSEGDVWITVQTSMNMVAVALMIDAACVIFPEGLAPPGDVTAKANEENLPLFTTDEKAYELAVRINKLIG